MKLTFVVLDCYDEFTFDRCLQSIGLQTMADYEVLVVGTRDVTQITAGGITAQYLTCIDDVQSILETTIDHAQSEFICFVNSVHCYSPFFAEKMTDMLSDGGDMACCGYVGIQQDTPLTQVGVPLRLYHPEMMTAWEYLKRCTGDDVVSMEMHNFFENKLYHRSLLESCRPLADESTIEAGIVQHLLAKCGDVAVTSEPLLFVCTE